MSRRGFALLAVLWVIAALAALVGAGLLVARLGSATTRNRILLARAEWARDACGEILEARFVADPTMRALAPIDLGRGTSCRAWLEDPGARVNLNTADRDVLAQLFAELRLAPTPADSVLARRSRGTIYDVREVPGFDSVAAARIAPFVTTRGSGAINVNAAPREILRLLPGMTEESVMALLSRRSTHPLGTADELSGVVSRSARATLLGGYAEFVRISTFAPQQLIATLEGSVRGPPAIVARATLTVVPVPGRLAVVRRESE